MRKPKPLTRAQVLLLEVISECDSESPFMPMTAGERSTVDALDRRELLDGGLFEASRKQTRKGTLIHYTRCVWLNDAGRQALAEATKRSP